MERSYQRVRGQVARPDERDLHYLHGHDVLWILLRSCL